MSNPEQSMPEGVIEDTREAAEAAQAEKVMRDFLSGLVADDPSYKEFIRTRAEERGEEHLQEFRKSKEEQIKRARELLTATCALQTGQQFYAEHDRGRLIRERGLSDDESLDKIIERINQVVFELGTPL